MYIGPIMAFNFPTVTPRVPVDPQQWMDWFWQMRKGLKTKEDFSEYFKLSLSEEMAFTQSQNLFRSQTTPYYASLASYDNVNDPIRRILMPSGDEFKDGEQQMLDPLGERQQGNRPASRLVHRYSDRVLFLVTDLCSVYCRYCTRKHFTATDQAFLSSSEYTEALQYIRSHSGVREVIFSGGDPLTLSDGLIDRVLSDVRQIPHVEIIRVHSRMPVVSPMRITDDLVKIFKKNKPVFLITHFNHPQELSAEAAVALEKLVDHGVPTLNQMVLLNGINNHPALIQALSRRLLYLRVKPYYMFQCDPSLGTDHLRTSIEDSLEIQKELWGHLSGLAMPTYIVDIPSGGGKAALTPDFQTEQKGTVRKFKGWDGVEAEYKSPVKVIKPHGIDSYIEEWEQLKRAKVSSTAST